MSKKSKILEKICEKPIRSDIKWNEIKNCLEGLGYVLIKNSGSRRKFYHKEKDILISCHEPHPSPNVDKGCIADIVEHLKINGLVE